MRVLKIILIALGACVLALAAAALFVVASWSQFEPTRWWAALYRTPMPR